MIIDRIQNGFLLNAEGYWNNGTFVKSNEVISAIRLSIDDIRSIFSQFEALGNSDAEEVSITIGRFTYDLQRADAKELLAIVSMVQFDEEPLPIEHTWPEEFWTEEYLSSL